MNDMDDKRTKGWVASVAAMVLGAILARQPSHAAQWIGSFVAIGGMVLCAYLVYTHFE